VHLDNEPASVQVLRHALSAVPADRRDGRQRVEVDTMDANRRPPVVGVFDSREQAERAIDALHAAGFSGDQLGIAARGEQRLEEAVERRDERMEDRTRTVGGAVTGGVAGGLIGAVLAGLIPGVGPVIAAGALAGILGGAVTGAAVGGMVGALMDMGVTEEEAQQYDREFRAGRTIVTVRTDGRHQEAMDILRRHGSLDLESEGPVDVDRASSDIRTRREPVEPGLRRDEDRQVPLRYSAGPIEITTVGEDPAEGHGRANFGEGSASSIHNVRVERIGPEAESYSAARWEDVEPSYRSRWLERHGGTGEQWEQQEPRYRYAWLHTRRPEHAGRSWDEVEPELRRGWREEEHRTPWEQAVDAMRDVWERRDLGAPIIEDRRDEDDRAT
jgi:hypothetical protein